MSYFLTNDFEHTVETFEPLVDSQETNLDFLYVLGIAYGRLKRTEESTRTFEQLVRAGGDSAQLHLLMGKAHLDLDELSLAQDELEKSVALDRQNCTLPTTTSEWFIRSKGNWIRQRPSIQRKCN